MPLPKILSLSEILVVYEYALGCFSAGHSVNQAFFIWKLNLGPSFAVVEISLSTNSGSP